MHKVLSNNIQSWIFALERSLTHLPFYVVGSCYTCAVQPDAESLVEPGCNKLSSFFVGLFCKLGGREREL